MIPASVKTNRLRLFVVLYGVLNAAAYSCLLPLWEGFDETFHYGYVQLLSTGIRFPALHEATLSREIRHSLDLVPVSHFMQPTLRAPLNFGDYFQLPMEERQERRRQLESIPSSEKWERQTDMHNYEATQSPASYLFMAVIDWMLLNLPLTTRVLALRLICAILAILLLADAARRLAVELALGQILSDAALFCAFSSQMLYGTLCHVSNDTFAVPAAAYLMLAAIRAVRGGARRDWLLFGVAFGVALLIKAHALFLLPLALLAVRRRESLLYFAAPMAALAGPWYLRNVLLYSNLSGTLNSSAGMGIGQVLSGFFQVHWRESISTMAHMSLWTGNSSFTTISATTLNLVLLLLAVAVALFFLRARRAAAEWIIVAAVISFSCGMAAVTAMFYSGTNGLAFFAMPWYSQLLLVPILLIAFLGLQRTPSAGRLIGPLTAALWAYVMAATYIVKLIPMYAGLGPSRLKVGELKDWYVLGGQQRDAMLETISLGNLGALKPLLAATLLLLVALCLTLAVKMAFPRRGVDGQCA